MKAVILKKLGEAPEYGEFPTPQIQNEEQLILDVSASALKNLDKLMASGTHYASHKKLPVVVGMDGVGTLENGNRVYAQGITGMIAEKALINKNKYTLIPDNLDSYLAAAVPNAVLGAAMPLKVRGKIEPGQNVLVNGATGVTGQLAVQLAKYYGARTIVVTGRNTDNLEKTRSLGADKTVSLKQDEMAIVEQLKEIHSETPIDLVIDYLWGNPIEWVINSLKGGGMNNFTHSTKIITVGSMAGETINLSSGTLRSAAIEILGSGFGSLSLQDFENFQYNILPEMFKLAADGKLNINLVVDKMENIESLWTRKIVPGKRLVISIE